MERPKTLSAVFVRKVTRPGRYGDGRGGYGLSLLVKRRSNGRWSKTWSQRLRRNGVPFNVGLGSFPVVSLAEARAAALENARAVHQGEDPRKQSTTPTFRDAAEEVLRLHSSHWRNPKTAVLWQGMMGRHVYPALGDMLVAEVGSGDVLRVLLPLLQNGKRETARRLRQRLSAVMKHAVAQGWRSDDPAGDAIAAALPKNGTTPPRHHRALPHAEVADAIAKVKGSRAWTATKLLMEHIILTAARSGEAREGCWSEIDFEVRIWSIPASRMKSGREHRVPLSTRALEVLREAAELRDGSELADRSGLVFPSPTGRPLSNMTTSKLLRDCGINATTHGFRTSFRSWCAEQNAPREVAEAALAHAVRGVEGSYQRSDLFELRRELMQRWADYISQNTSI